MDGGMATDSHYSTTLLNPPSPQSAVMEEESDAHFGHDAESDRYVIVNATGATLCVAFVALISCMFLGFLTLDELDLQIKTRAAIDLNERVYAAALLPIVRQHHRLLVTLLLLNAIAYEALPLFLDNLVPSWAAILLSVTFLLIFGEVIPSAIFTGPDQLRLASRLVPLIRASLFILWPIATPIVKLLDYLVPHDEEDDLYHRGELSALIKIQHEEREAKKARENRHLGMPKRNITSGSRSWRAFKKEIMEAVQEKQRSRSNSFADDTDMTEKMEPPPLDTTEVKVVEGALSMKTKVAMDVYTSLHNIYSIPSDMVLNKASITKIYGQGYSRVPVYAPDPEYPESKSGMIGILLSRALIVIDWDHEREVNSLPLQIPPCVSARMNLVELLKLLQSGQYGGSMMAFVCARPDLARKALDNGKPIPGEAGFMGLITLEDVLENILQTTIIDEEDQTDRNLASATLTHWAAQKIQESYRRRKKAREKRKSLSPNKTATVTPSQDQNAITEETSLLENGQLENGRYSSR